MWHRLVHSYSVFLGFPAGSVVQNQPEMQETLVPPLVWEDTLEKDVTTHSSIFAWEIP